MRSILEQAIVHQLNGEGDKAQELFHQFVVARARQIHESMRNGEDPLSEGWDDEVRADTYFNEEDLASLEDDNVDDVPAGDVMADDEMADDDMDTAVDDDVDAPVGELEDELDAHEEEDEVTADRVSELEDQLADLVAAYEELTGKSIGDDDADADVDADDMDEPELEDDMDEMPMADDEDGDDEFDGLGESVAHELEKVAVHLEDGKEVGAGPRFAQQRKTALPQKKVGERQGGDPINLKSSRHSGFARETHPTVADMKTRRNTMKKADAKNAPVSGGAEKGGTKELGGKTVGKPTDSTLSKVSRVNPKKV